MSGNLHLADVVTAVVAFEAALLLMTGTWHATGRGSRRALGLLEIALVVCTTATVIAGTATTTLVAQVAVAGASIAFLVYLAVRRRTSPHESCGCHPFSSSVSRASFLPAAALLASAGSLIASSFAGLRLVVSAAPSRVAVVVLLGLSAAGLVLIRSGASDVVRSPERV